MAGSSREDDPAKAFSLYLSGLASIPLDPTEKFRKWGISYYSRYKGWAFSLLIVNPDQTSMWILRVSGNGVELAPHPFCAINGNEYNPAIIWPEYFSCDRRPLHTLKAATNVAAMTILTGGALNPLGVGDLEVWQFTESAGKWHPRPLHETNDMIKRFQNLKVALQNFVGE
jgi:hypothetical protein